MRKCVIHIGTHNTGTTSIQHLLSRNSSALETQGYLYARAGRLELHPGHHNLAWEISGDDRFQNRYGTIADLIREVTPRAEDIILSSEDLECAFHNRVRFAAFISSLQSCGCDVTAILYVRAQSTLLRRIYLELRIHGFDRRFQHVLEPAFATAEVRWRNWIFNFDYCDLPRRVDDTSNVNVIVRSYDQARTSICSDFLSVLNLTLRDLHVGGEVVENVALPLRDYLLMFLQNRMGRTLRDDEASKSRL